MVLLLIQGVHREGS